MKFRFLPLIILQLISASAAESKHPQRIQHSLLSSSDAPLLSALSHNGLVAVTSIPNFAKLKHNAMKSFTECVADRDASVELADGTLRRSFAMSNDNVKLPSTPSCFGFKENLIPFRAMVDSVVETFALRLSAEMSPSLQQPLLTGVSNGKDLKWDSIQDIVLHGEYLDHFHSYQKLSEGEEHTLEFHVDQGLLLAFTPGLMMDLDSVKGVSEGFYVRDVTGDEYELSLDEEDDLVFMFGDGVNQYINNRLFTDKASESLVATPHALKLKAHQDPSLSRAWFGRMILPPQQAFISSGDPATFGKIRSDIIEHFSSSNKPIIGIGCSTWQQELGLHGSSISRDLQECAEDEFYCWFRCQVLADHGLTPTTCTERNLMLQCANPRDQVVPDGKAHGEYFPSCTNSTDPVTDYPKIEQQDNETCPDLWEDFLATDEDYDHVVDLTVPNGPETHFMYSVIDDTIKGRLVHDNVHGWLAMGFANPGGKHNGMNGGHVILATPYSTEDYSPVTGLDTSSDEAMIATYTIDTEDSAFRHWQNATNEEALIANVETNDCSTALSFEMNQINGKAFNVNGTDEMLWAGNSVDHFVGYHGPFNRMRFTIDWKLGEAVPFSAAVQEEHNEHEDHKDGVKVTASIEDIASDIVEPNSGSSAVEVESDGSGAADNNASVFFILSLFMGAFAI